MRDILDAVPKRNISEAVKVMIAGYKQNGSRGLSTIAFCEAQIEFMADNGIARNHPIVNEYRNQIELERGRV